MELIKKQIHYITEGKNISDRFYLDEDINVPDEKCGIRKIIYGSADVKACEVCPEQKQMRVTGSLHFQILYMTEEAQPQVEAIEGNLPFEETVYEKPDEMGIFYIRDIRNEFTYSLVHSRKISARAMIEVEIGRESVKDEEAATDIKPDDGIYKKVKKATALELHTYKKDTYRIKEEIRLTEEKEGIGRILFTDISVGKFRMRLGGGELYLNGQLSVFCIYKSEEGKIQWVERDVPFEGKIECDGVSEDMYYCAQSRLEDARLSARADEDGEMRVLLAEGSLILRINIYREEELELLADMYSLKQNTGLTFKDAAFEELIIQNHSNCKISKRLTFPAPEGCGALKVCRSSGNVRIEHAQQVKGGLKIEGVVCASFIYIQQGGSAPFGGKKETIPFSYLLEDPHFGGDVRFCLSGHVEQLSAAPSGSKEAEVRAVLSFDALLRRPFSMKVITEAKDLGPYGQDYVKRPGIVGYIVKEKDELWDLAKKYMTTVKRIQDVNGLESEAIRPGEKLLILKENMTVL